MSVPQLLETLTGGWTGTSTLVLPTLPPPGSVSKSVATIGEAALGRFGRIDYSWAYEGTPHQGLLLAGQQKKRDTVEAVWIDSWHQSETFLLLHGGIDASGALTVTGHYPAPTGPDWGWRISVRPLPDGWELVMDNISPDGESELAFHNIYRRPAGLASV